MIEFFKVIHISGEIRMAYGENDRGFLHINPMYPMIGLNSPYKYTLLKPKWKRKEVQ